MNRRLQEIREEMRHRNDLRSSIPKPSGYYLEKALEIERKLNSQRKLHTLGTMFLAEKASTYNR